MTLKVGDGEPIITVAGQGFDDAVHAVACANVSTFDLAYPNAIANSGPRAPALSY